MSGRFSLGALITTAIVDTTGLPPGPGECLDTGFDAAAVTCGPADVFGTALAVADYGSLGVLAQIDVDYTVTPCDPSPYPFCGGLNHRASASAGFVDTLTVSHPTLGGSSAFIAFVWALSGSGSLTTIDPSGLSQVRTNLSLAGSFNGALFSHWGTGIQQNGTLTMAGDQFTTPYVSITLGSPFDIGFLLDTQANVDLAAPVGVPFTVDGIMAFDNTALLTGLLVTDALGNPLGDFLISATSERSYPYRPTTQEPPAQVPEPSSGLLLAAGMTLLLWRRRRQENR
jgi:hypothetical protein